MAKNDQKTYRIIKRHIQNIFLDPNNYRFIDDSRYTPVNENEVSDDKVQKRTTSLIMGDNRENVRDLINSFKENGYLPVDHVQVKDLGGNNYLVIEGNRRIATLKALRSDHNQDLDIGHLNPQIFRSFPFMIHDQEDLSHHMVIMGLKHISGTKKWPPINQARHINDLITKYGFSEARACMALGGISKQKLRKTQRSLALIDSYKNSDYGDQFISDKYSIFEEIVGKPAIRSWLEWDEDDYICQNTMNEAKLFGWISREEENYDDVDDDENVKIFEPIITKSSEIRELAQFINEKNAVAAMERERSISYGLAASDVVAENKFQNALQLITEQVQTAFNFSEYMKDEDTSKVEILRDKLDKLVPTSKASIFTQKHGVMNNFAYVRQHFSELTLTSFKLFNDIKIRKLNRINIFAGINNSGKSSVLEAVHLLANQNNPNGIFDVLKRRNKASDQIHPSVATEFIRKDIALGGVFNGKETKIEIKEIPKKNIDKTDYITSLHINSESCQLQNSCRIDIYREGNSQTFFNKLSNLCPSLLNSPYNYDHTQIIEAHAFNIENIKYSQIIAFIRNNIIPKLTGINLTEKDNVKRFQVTIEDKSRSFELSSFGEGLQRIFEISMLFAMSSNGIVLIDEIETAIHKSLLRQFTSFIQKLAKEFNVQVFMTSHSKECIDAFIKNNVNLDDITAFALSTDDDGVQCKYIDGPRLNELIDAINIDIRN